MADVVWCVFNVDTTDERDDLISLHRSKEKAIEAARKDAHSEKYNLAAGELTEYSSSEYETYHLSRIGNTNTTPKELKYAYYRIQRREVED